MEAWGEISGESHTKMQNQDVEGDSLADGKECSGERFEASDKSVKCYGELLKESFSISHSSSSELDSVDRQGRCD